MGKYTAGKSYNVRCGTGGLTTEKQIGSEKRERTI